MSHNANLRLAAILCADVEAFSRLTANDEAGTLRMLDWHRITTDRLIAQWGGRIANTAGDSIVAEFSAMASALRCALDIQEEIEAKNREVASGHRLSFRIGLHVGEVYPRGDDLLGDGVNMAARIQSEAPAGGVYLSDVGHHFVDRPGGALFEDIGLHVLKNIPTPQRIWRALTSAAVDRPVIPRLHQRAIFHLARRFQRICDGILAEITAKEDLLPLQYVILASLEDSPNSTVQDLAMRLGITFAECERLVAYGLDRGLITQSSHPNLSDIACYRLTNQGSILRNQLKPLIARAMEQVVAPLSETERTDLHNLLVRVIQAHESRPA